ncbi:methyl-accepting chemotaxis protein [Sporolactobacillus terrae]|uniref:Chemotaxis protein n=1 Tax=Sporolactobacillus terrae TaxID=269673 RepID=A0A5K7WYX1_9BACL|nr:methyl-accepting chemotaxis protein [Sporolactobacillus terrae]BBN99587.1 chemotaxis protein [Sporolactobacillus terrae]
MIQEKQKFDLQLLSRAFEENLSLISFNTNHKVIFVNDNFSKALGYTKEEMIGMDHAMLCFPDFASSADYQDFWNKLLGGNRFQDKVKRKDKLGHAVWLEATYMPIFDETHSHVIGVLKVATNISQREQRIKQFTDSLKDTAADLHEQAQAGNHQTKALNKEITNVERFSNENAETLATLQQEIKQINGVVEIIRAISEQTHILAINAGIEGARSGESGRSFIVIAKEMQKLSDQVHQSIKKVEEQTRLIIANVNQIADRSGNLQHNAKVSHETMEVATQVFDKIGQAAELLNDQAKALNKLLNP